MTDRPRRIRPEIKIRSSPTSFEMLTPEVDAGPLEIAEPQAEMRRVVSRLQACMVPALQSAERMDRRLGADDLRAVIAALEAEADGLDPRPGLHSPDEILHYLRQTLYEELLAEPSNILHTTRVNDKVVRYEAMPRNFWKQCLARLRTRLKLDADAAQ
jgi:hypothetical protein